MKVSELKSRPRHFIRHLLETKRNADVGYAELDNMTIEDVRKELTINDVPDWIRENGFGKKTRADIIKILGGSLPEPHRHKRKTFRLFGRKIIISIY